MGRDLDLPTQKEMLALFRCGEISDEVYNEFVERIRPLGQQLKNNEHPETFGADLSAIVADCMEKYEKPASWYHQETAAAKGKELLSKMKKDVYGLYLEYLGKLRAKVLTEFDSKVQNVVPENENEIMANFANVMSQFREEALSTFEEKSKDASITQAEGEWSSENDYNELRDTIDKRIADAREIQMRRVVDKVEKNIKIKVAEPLEDVLEEPNEDMWIKIRSIEAEGQKRTSALLSTELSAFACSEEDTAKRLNDLHRRIRAIMNETIKKHVDTLYDHIMKLFTQKFQYDEGLPRKWTKEVNVEELYTRCKEEVTSVIKLFAINRLDESNDELTYKDDVPADLILLSQREASQLKKRFTQTSDAMFTTARSEQERNNVATQIPAFFIVLLLIFAFDEIIWILSNPFLFMLAVCVGAVFGLLWYLDMLYLVKPIFNSVLSASVANVHAILTSNAEDTPKEKTE